MFGTQLNPATLIRKQWIAKEYLATDLIFIGRRDKDYEHGYKPHIMQMETLRDIIASQIRFTDLFDTPAAMGNPGEILQVNAGGTALEFVDPVDTFLELTDTPADYTGFAGYSVVVNGTEDGLEFQAPPPAEELKFEARLNFAGAIAPVVGFSLEDALGVTVTWSRTAPGTYRATFSAPVNQNNLIMWIGSSTVGTFVPTVYNTSYIEFEHHPFAGGGPADATQTNVSVEIKLYP